jgi:DNA-binding transcriptional LysR family regulator
MLQNNLLKVGRRLEEFARVVVYDDLHVIVEALVRGEGVAFLSSDLVKAHVEAGRLRAYRIPGFRHERRRTIVYGDGVTEGSMVANFVEKILLRLRPAGSVVPTPACS